MRKSRILLTLKDVNKLSSSIMDPSSKKRRKKPKIPTVTQIVNTLPLLFTQEDIVQRRAEGLRMIQLRFPMLRSINRQYKIAKGRMYTDPEYQAEKEQARLAVEEQVRAAGWTTTKDDLYLVVFDFSFAGETEQDVDGPVKATTDVLQRQNPSRKERETQGMVTPALVDLWKETHPYAIWNDGQIMLSLLLKHIHQDDLFFTVTVYAFAKQQFPVIPLHAMIHQFLCQPSYKKGFP